MLIKKILILTFLGFLVFFSGWLLYDKKNKESKPFDGILTISPEEYKYQINPNAPELKVLLKKIQTLPEAFYFVRDFIGFFPMVNDISIQTTLKNKFSNCLGKAVLLASLYSSLGVDKDDVRIMIGQFRVQNEIIDHSWVEVKINGVWYQQDTTDLLGRFEYNQFPDRTYSKTFCSRENFCFNETAFAIVSQLNLLK